MNMTSTSDHSQEKKHFGFWANLLLPRKMLLAFGVLFIVALLIAVITLSGSNRTQAAYEDAISQGIEVRGISDHMLISFLQARRAEKNFLLRWQSEGFDTAYTNYIPTYTDEIATIQEDIKSLSTFSAEAATVSTGDVTREQYDADIVSISQTLDTYVFNFTSLVEAYQQRGYDENTGFEGEFRAAAQAMEAKFTGQEGLEQLEITLLQIRRNEKDYLLRSDQKYVDNVKDLITQLKAQIALSDQIDDAAKVELRTQADSYLSSFTALVELDKSIAVYNADLITSARAVEPLAAKFEQLGEQLATDDIVRSQLNSTQTFTASIATVFFALIISIFLGFTLSRQITQPITQLTKTAQQISEGSFDIQADVTSGDEVGTLAQTFNSMTSRLGKAFEDVRRRSLAVETSAEVSRRLSAATNPNQLALEVVEQVKAAFHYYHAHIYFLDEKTGDLIMAGGTGEAGAAMLARGHKVPKGRGLVGRAAETNEPILVADVSQAEGWLPNPLLPETKSEAAIPISSGKQVLGVLDVQQNIVNGLNEEDVLLLQSLAGQVSISLQNARSFEQSKSQAELESLVNTIGQKIQRTTSVEDTLQTAIRELGLALGASRVAASIHLNREDETVSSDQGL